MHTWFKLHEHGLKFHKREINNENENDKERPANSSKESETIGKLVKGKGCMVFKQMNSYLRYSISIVEAIAHTLEDALIDGLSFARGKVASYITNIRSCANHPQGRNLYQSVAATKLINIARAGDDWLDPF